MRICDFCRSDEFVEQVVIDFGERAGGTHTNDFCQPCRNALNSFLQQLGKVGEKRRQVVPSAVISVNPLDAPLSDHELLKMRQELQERIQGAPRGETL